MIEATTLAYLAGVIDSDGFISAHRKKRGDLTYTAPLIGISGTSPEPYELAYSVWGGSLFTYAPKNPQHRLQFQWQAVGVRAANAIRDIEPYLRSKSRQASIAIEMWKMIDGGVHRTDSRLFDMASQLSDLNLRNPPLKPIPPELQIRQFPPGASA